MPEDPKEGNSNDSPGKKKGILGELKKGNKRSLLGIAVALAGIIVAWFLYQRSQAQQAAGAATYMPYTPNATAGTAGVPGLDNQLSQFQAEIENGFGGLSDSLAGLSTRMDDLNSSLSSLETAGGTITPSPIPSLSRSLAPKRYVMQSGHPVSYSYLARLGFIKGTPGHYLTTGKGGYAPNHPVDYAYLAAGRHPIIRAA